VTTGPLLVTTAAASSPRPPPVPVLAAFLVGPRSARRLPELSVKPPVRQTARNLRRQPEIRRSPGSRIFASACSCPDRPPRIGFASAARIGRPPRQLPGPSGAFIHPDRSAATRSTDAASCSHERPRDRRRLLLSRPDRLPVGCSRSRSDRSSSAVVCPDRAVAAVRNLLFLCELS
jgi:hypothetical protein